MPKKKEEKKPFKIDWEKHEREVYEVEHKHADMLGQVQKAVESKNPEYDFKKAAEENEGGRRS